ICFSLKSILQRIYPSSEHRLWQFSLHLLDPITETTIREGGAVEDTPLSPVETGVDELLGGARFGVKLHRVGLHAHDRAGVGGEKEMGDLGEHGVGEVLDHQGHAVGLGPAEAEEGAGLGLAGLEGDTGPAEFPAEPDET